MSRFQGGVPVPSMAHQDFAMQKHRTFRRLRKNPWTWRGLLRARAEGQVYVIDIEAGRRPGGRIRIWCREPDLVPLRSTGRPPHTFADGSLCVNDRAPSTYEFIADTTVPWIYSWLYFYERWVETGVWYGPQAPGHEIAAAAPEPPKDEPRSAPAPAPAEPVHDRQRGQAA